MLSDNIPRSALIARALREQLTRDVVWASTLPLTPSAQWLAEQVREAGAVRVILNVSPRAVDAWTPALRPLLARSAPSVIAAQWGDATLSASQFDALAGLVWATTWHPSLGGSERNWARRHRSLTGMVPGDAEVAAYSAALVALTSAGSDPRGRVAEAVVRDVFVPEARFGRDGCLPHGIQIRRRDAGEDEHGWPKQQLLWAASPDQSFDGRRSGASLK